MPISIEIVKHLSISISIFNFILSAAGTMQMKGKTHLNFLFVRIEDIWGRESVSRETRFLLFFSLLNTAI